MRLTEAAAATVAAGGGERGAYMTRPTIAVEMRVPPNASALMAPMLRKKGFTCKEKPASNMMGGRRAMKKKSVCNPNN